MNKKKLQFEAKIVNVTPINPLFARAYCKIGYAGKNRNGTYISKDTFENAISSLYYTPVVGEWLENKDNFGGHGGKVEIHNNDIKYIDTTIPYGCVASKEDINWRWELGEDGKEYFTVDIFLWIHKFPQLQKIIENNSWHSMEIDVVDGHDAIIEGSRIFVIEKMDFTALCILGKDLENPNNNVKPCFESSEIGIYSLDKKKFKNEFNKMIKELKYSLSSDVLKYQEWYKNTLNFINDDEIGKGETINIKNNKEFAKDGKWSNPESKLYNSILKASNYRSLVEEAYIIIDGDFETSPSTKLHYPHHVISDGELVLHINGMQSAFARAKQQGLTGEPIAHLKRHYKELGLNQDNFAQFNLDLKDYKEYFAKEDSEMEDLTMAQSPEKLEMENTDTQKEEMCNHEAGENMCNDGKNYEEKASDEKASEDSKEEEAGESKEEEKKETEAEEKKEEKNGEEMSLKYDELSKEYCDVQAKYGELFANYEKLKTSFSEIEAKLKDYELKEKKTAVDAVFSEFFNLLTEDETKEIREKAMDMEIDVLKHQLYSIYGVKMYKFNLQNSQNSQGVINMGINPEELNNKKDANIDNDIFAKAKKELGK